MRVATIGLSMSVVAKIESYRTQHISPAGELIRTTKNEHKSFFVGEECLKNSLKKYYKSFLIGAEIMNCTRNGKIPNAAVN